MDIFSTADAPRNTRTAWWNSVYSSRLAPVRFEPLDRDRFEAELRVGSIGGLELARVHAMATDIERSRVHISGSRGRLFSFLVPLRGSAGFTHYGHETALAPGDITLCDGAMPHRLRCGEATELLILRAAPETLRAVLPDPERFCGRRLPADAAFAAAAATLVQSLWCQLERGLPERFAGLAARNTLDVLATACAMAFGTAASATSVVAARRLRAERFIETHLRDHDLTPARVAESLHISPRYLRMLFEDGTESVTGYILRRRLEECAKQIASPLWAGHTITAIAFASGFNSAAHFTRAFRERFDTTPTGYRRRHLARP